ncbi:SNF related kinase b [Rhincodon typus]|uniref:SNF related kinase b n=1 Tax=Rhincodon typus TaxID=259920 RepID=UPI00202FEF30|nr:SNF related kinase b [Rhincodon typus]
MLQRDPKKRASLEEIEGHPWLQGVDPSPAKKLSLPLTSYKSLSEEEHEIIIQAMECGNIAQRELIQEALEADKYNHITASYFLLAERILREKQEKHTQSRNLNLDYNWSTHVQCRPSLSTAANSFVDATDSSPLPEMHNGFSIKHSTPTTVQRKQPEAEQKDAEEEEEMGNTKDIAKVVTNAQDSSVTPSPMRVLLRSSLETSVMPKNMPVLQQICEEDEDEEEEEDAEMEIKATPLPNMMQVPCAGTNQQTSGCPSKDTEMDGNKLFHEMWSCQRESGVMNSSVEVPGSVGPLCCSRWAGKSEPLSSYFANRPINLMNESNNNSTSKGIIRAPVDISDISVQKAHPCPHSQQCPASLDSRVTESIVCSTDLAKDKLQGLQKCEGPSVESPKHLIDWMAENSGLANDNASIDSSADPVNKFDSTRSKNINIRDRILQIPLCEKALSFKIKPNSKENLLSFGQFNCCHVI